VTVLAARTAGAGTIIVTGLARDAAKLALAREFGADHTINVEAEDTVARVLDITGGAGADVVLELTPMASQPVLDAMHAVRWGGRVVLAGLKGGRLVELPTDLLINKSLTVVGAFSVDSRAYAEAIRLIEGGAARLAGPQLLLQHLLRRGEPAAVRRALVPAGGLRPAAGHDRPGVRLLGLPR